MEEGFHLGKRPEMTGGGLIRSLGGWTAAKAALRGIKERVKKDERILGEGDFVQEVLMQAGNNSNGATGIEPGDTISIGWWRRLRFGLVWNRRSLPVPLLPMFSYLGQEGYLVNLELRAGRIIHSSQKWFISLGKLNPCASLFRSIYERFCTLKT
ncbi:MAG: hypothetical protein WA151_12860 [Desulfatirhabdiaceae bacterium]